MPLKDAHAYTGFGHLQVHHYTFPEVQYFMFKKSCIFFLVQAAITRTPQIGWLKQQTVISYSCEG